MVQFNLYEAKTNLSQLVDRAAAGEAIVIAKNGRPVAALVALDALNPAPVREFGFLSGAMPTLSDEAWERLWQEGDADLADLFADYIVP
jgi:prevent-host-death family protein